MKRRFFTSESVTEGHPDKICDQISDAILDEILTQDKLARVACESVVTTGLVLVMGEITTSCYVDIPAIVRKTITDIGYTRAKYGFDGNTCGVITSIHEQSSDIAVGVDSGGAGDQGMMFGFACRETEELMPLPINLAHKLTMGLSQARRSGEIPYLRPDGKSQVTVEYVDGKPKRVDTIVLSSQHSPDVDYETLKNDITEKVIMKSIPEKYLDGDTKILVNPTGIFVIGGPHGDSGLTGRKIIVDTYGGYCPHGGGSFSGKDPTKVDRSASYMARYVCKNVVAAGLADRCELQVSYAIGVAEPISLFVNTFGTGRMDDGKLLEIIKREFDFRPLNIIEKLDLRRPIYRQTAAFGHFGRSGFPWEELDMVEALKKYIY
ncbi:MAG: methionine adenosyltransferase [Clostridiales bacterium]|nr:methionine adenosyltransferase [Clostridiales bacterium]